MAAIVLWTLATVTLAVTGLLFVVPPSWLQRLASSRPTNRRSIGVAAFATAAVFAVLAVRGGQDTPAWPAVAGGSPAATAPLAATAAGADARTALEIEAQTARRARDFNKAVAAFERLAQQGGMSADLWADYADAVGAAHGGLGDAEPQIRQALSLDAKHPKALWLLGSLQTERRDFRAALETWQALLAVLPPDSPDARLVAANRDEAHAALTGTAMPMTGAPAPQAAKAGTAEMFVDERWLKRP